MIIAGEQQQVEAKLKRIRSLHLMMIGILACYIPAIVLLYLMQLPELLIMSVALLLISVGISIAFIIGFARCPVCNRYFHIRGISGNIFVRKCMNCGLDL